MSASSTVVCMLFWTAFWKIAFGILCPGVRRDLAILLDDSGSLSAEDLETSKDFLKDFINVLDVGQDAFQIAVVKFSDKPKPIAYFGNETKRDLIRRVERITHYGGKTYTHKALDFSLRRVFKKKNNRDDVLDQILIITDGKSDNTKETARQIQKAHAQNIQMIAVGIGAGVNDDELQSLASRDDLVFKVNDFSDLDSIRDKLLVASCGERTTSTTTTTTTSTPSTTETTTTTTTTTTIASTTSSTPTTTTTTSTTSTTRVPKTTLTTTARQRNTTTDHTEETITNINQSKANSTFGPGSNWTTDDNYDIGFNHGNNEDFLKHGFREKTDMLDSAHTKWQHVMGGTIAAFVLTALITGLVALVIKKYGKKKRQQFVETL